MITESKIILKTLAELEHDINSGKAAYAAHLNHADARVGLIEPGRYFVELDIHPGGDIYIQTSEGETSTLSAFVESIEWDETEPYDIEFKTYLSQKIWFVGDDINSWDMDRFVFPENHIDSMEVIHASCEQAKINRQRTTQKP